MRFPLDGRLCRTFGRTVLVVVLALGGTWARAGDRIVVYPRRVAVPTTQPLSVVPPRSLGTFYPQPYMTVLGNGRASGGYSPLGMYGHTTLSEYGPLSAFRQVTAPVQTYTRGYDGSVRPAVGVGFSYPNMPAASQVIYPTRANNAFGFGYSRTPPHWDNAINWLDQN